MFSELAGSGSLLFCQNKDDVTALPVSLCPNFSFLPSTCLSPFPSAPSVKFGNVSEGYYLRDSMSLQFLPKSERDPAGAHTGGVASHYIHSSQVLQSFAAFCAVIFCSLSNREAKHPRCHWDGEGDRKGMEGLQGCWMQEVELCSRARSGVENRKHFTSG